MAYEDVSNDEIIAGVAVRWFLTPYRLRMAAGERIAQQAARIAELERQLAAFRSVRAPE